MMICPHCGWTGGSGANCERCTALLVAAHDKIVRPAENARPDSDAEWITIARFGNAAEAGYFAHELAQVINSEPRIEYQDDFDAIGGAWRTRYLLTVPERFAEHGRRHLAAMLEGNWEHDHSGPVSDDSLCEIGATGSGRQPTGQNSRINWVPIMLTLAAGSAVLWAGKRAQLVRRPEPGKAGQRDLLDILADGAHPWVQHREDGGRQRELRVNPRAGTATVYEDTDGDGRFDRELEFPVRTR